MTRVFSFCLYGPEQPRYHVGIIENIRIIQEHFPEWKVYVYVAPDVSRTMLIRLQSFPSVVLRYTGEFGKVNMIYRFYAIDEPEVEIMLCRDADSLVHWKDRWAIQEFLNSSYMVHVIRDNYEHIAMMMGGLWGMRKIDDISIRDLHTEFKLNPKEMGAGEDQNFLSSKLYPRVIDVVLAHYSFERCQFVREHAVKFPFEWTNDVYCGRIEKFAPETTNGVPEKTLTRGMFTNILRKK